MSLKLQKLVLTNTYLSLYQRKVMFNKDTALLLIDVQKAFTHKSWGNRNNLEAEDNIKILLKKFREKKLPVIHIQHTSKNPTSLFHLDQCGIEFMDFACPQSGEQVFQKEVNSAFIGTHLNEFLKSKEIKSLVVVGFTTDHCVSTSVRMASNLGFQVFMVSDVGSNI